MDAGYRDVAIGRWEAFTGEHAVLAETGERFSETADRRLAVETGDENASVPIRRS
jgi:hypothetical protein